MKLCIIFATFLSLAFASDNDEVVPEPKSTCTFEHTFSNVGDQAYLRSPNYPNNYPNNADCKYTLHSPSGTQISLNCTDFNVEWSTGCAYDKMTVSLTGDSNLKDGMIACGQGNFTRLSISNALVVGFTSDSSNPASQSVYRFQCFLTVIKNAQVPPTTTTPASPPAAAPPAAPVPDTCSCGTRNEVTRIVGGTTALTNEFPWRAALYSPTMGVFCGGTIISQNWVLTAAHCIAELRGRPLYVDVGDHDLSISTEAQNEVIQCAQIIQHADYNNQTYNNDLALCRLERPLKFNRGIQPGCLPWSMVGQNFQGKSVVTSGWGTTSYRGQSSTVLRKVELPVKTTEECREYYKSAITDNMFCTYSAGKDTCQGDSGGSIDYRNPNNGRYYAIGVVSWGIGCAGVNQPGVYVKMTNYLNWIIQNTAGETFCRL